MAVVRKSSGSTAMYDIIRHLLTFYLKYLMKKYLEVIFSYMGKS
jgi:hypothetical protein